MHFARHLRSERLGEFTIGTELHRSDSLGLVQLLILYHLVTARAVVSLGGGSARDFDLSRARPARRERRDDRLLAAGEPGPSVAARRKAAAMPLALTSDEWMVLASAIVPVIVAVDRRVGVLALGEARRGAREGRAGRARAARGEPPYSSG